MAVSLWPPARSGPVGLATWFVSAIVNESPFLAFCYVVASTLLAGVHGARLWVALGLAAAPFVGTPVLVRRSLRAAPAIEEALECDLWSDWGPARAVPSIATRPPWARAVFAPVPVFHPSVSAYVKHQLRRCRTPQPPRSLQAPRQWQRRAGADQSARWRLRARAQAQELLRAAAAVPAPARAGSASVRPTACNPKPPSPTS
jgi:hypothetical protein